MYLLFVRSNAPHELTSHPGMWMFESTPWGGGGASSTALWAVAAAGTTEPPLGGGQGYRDGGACVTGFAPGFRFSVWCWDQVPS